jgi:DNA-binding NarL/FixJ family response regulator
MIVEDQATIREMLVVVLAQMPEFEIVAQAATFEEAWEQVVRTEPDLVVLDWAFPGGGGSAFLAAVRAERLRCRVLVLTGNTSEEMVREALSLGARGVFEKGGNLEEFFGALRTVAGGGAYFGPMVAGIVQHLIDVQAASPASETVEAVEQTAGTSLAPSVGASH